jgi:hypothetical protein
MDTIQTKIKGLMEKLNPFVIDLNLEKQLKEVINIQQQQKISIIY